MSELSAPSTRRRGGTGTRLVATAVALAGLYSLGALLPFWFLDAPESGAAFFPAAGLTLALLTLSDKRYWPLWIAIIATCEFAIDVTHGQSVAMAIGFALANTVEPVVGATALRPRYFRHRPQLRQMLIDYLTCAVLLGPFVGALIGATTVTLFADPAASWIEIVGRWWLGDGLGVLVVATPILAFERRDRRTPLLSTTELALIVGVAVAVLVVPALLWHHPMIYAVLPVLLWAAFRGGTFAVSVTGVGIALAANWVAVTGRVGDLVVGQKSEQLLFLQIYLAIILLSSLTVAIEVEERHRLERKTKRAERDRVVAEQRTAEVELHERSRLASETHDIVGHGLNVMLLQAGAARRLLPGDPEQARLLLTSLEEVGRRACRDLDVVLAAERANPAAEDRGLSAVPGLVALLREAGLHIELTMHVPDGSLPTLVDRSAYRVVREALTNVAKHAPLAATRVTVQQGASELHLEVIDDGAGVPAKRNGHNGEGMGIDGMRARVASLSGELIASPLPQGGFAVMATIPTTPGVR